MEKWRKNWRNQLFTVALLFMMILLFGSVSAAAASDFTYDVNDDNTATITSCTAKGNIVIPSVIDGHTVVSLQPELFYGRSNVTTVSIPETVTQIGIWDYVFSYCFGLKAINVATDNPAFCSVDGVLFSKDKKILYNYPCAKSGKTYHVPAETETICCTAFASNANLNKLYLDSSETIWYTYTFYNTGNMTVYYLPGGATEKRVQSTIEYGQNFEKDPLYPKFRLSEQNTTEDASNKKTADKPTKFNIKNKEAYKKAKKVTIKDLDGIKSIKLNNKKIKVKSGKKSFSFKLSKYNKYLKKKTKWNKLVVMDVKGRKKTIKFKVK